MRLSDKLKASVAIAVIALAMPWGATAGGPPLCPNVVPNLPTGCTVTVVPGINKQYSYCHKNISSIPQYCPGPQCPGAVPAKGDWNVPGMNCGGAIPLLDPIPVAPADALPSCPPDNWCINPANTAPIFSDGSIHINDGAPAGTYNITISMGQNYLYVKDVARIYSLKPMGTCAEKFAGSSGALLLSMGYSYLVTPSSITLGDGSYCYGKFNSDGISPCDYTNKDALPAPHPVEYTSIYDPYAVVRTMRADEYGGNPDTIPPTPGVSIPYLNLPPGTQIWLSLKVPGQLRMPEGGMIITSTGGLISIPPRGVISTVGDGSTINLAPTPAAPRIAYLLDTPTSTLIPNEVNMNVVDQSPCYVQVVPPDGAQQVVKCSNTIPTALPIDIVPNPAIMVLATGLQVPVDTPLPIFTLGESCNPADAQVEGSIITPQFCVNPQVFDSLSQQCVDLKATCPDGTEVPPYTGTTVPVPEADRFLCGKVDTICRTTSGGPPGCSGSSSLWADGLVDPSTVQWTEWDGTKPYKASSTLTCSYQVSGNYMTYSPNVECIAGSPGEVPICNVSGYTWCGAFQVCIWSGIGNEPSVCGNLPPTDPGVNIPPPFTPVCTNYGYYQTCTSAPTLDMFPGYTPTYCSNWTPIDSYNFLVPFDGNGKTAQCFQSNYVTSLPGGKCRLEGVLDGLYGHYKCI